MLHNEYKLDNDCSLLCLWMHAGIRLRSARHKYLMWREPDIHAEGVLKYGPHFLLLHWRAKSPRHFEWRVGGLNQSNKLQLTASVPSDDTRGEKRPKQDSDDQRWRCLPENAADANCWQPSGPELQCQRCNSPVKPVRPQATSRHLWSPLTQVAFCNLSGGPAPSQPTFHWLQA